MFWVCTYKNGRRLLRKVVPNDPIQLDVYIRLTHLLSSSRPLNTIMRINTKALFHVKDILRSIGGMFYSSFLGRILIKVGRNTLTPMTS